VSRGQLAAAVAPGVALCAERKPQAPAVFRSNSLQPASYSTSEGVVPCYALMPLPCAHRAQAEQDNLTRNTGGLASIQHHTAVKLQPGATVQLVNESSHTSSPACKQL
jgi:hypothetical protein